MSAIESLEKEERSIRLLWILMLLILILTKYATQYAFGEKIGAIYRNQEFGQLANEIVIACEISIIIFVVEEKIRRMHLRKVELNVLQATLSMSVPDELADELAMIIKEPVYRENLRYHLTFLPPMPGHREAASLFILRMEARYTVRNITDIRQSYKIGGTFDDRHDMLLPDHQTISIEDAIVVKINGRRVKFLRTDVGDRRSPSSVGIYGQLLSVVQRRLLPLTRRRVTNLYIDRKKKSFWFSKKIGVPGSGTVDVYIKTDEVLPLAQRRNVYVQLRPSVNLYLSISNAYREKIREIGLPDLNHRSGVFTADHEASYRFEGGILPGQSFDVNWELKDD